MAVPRIRNFLSRLSSHHRDAATLACAFKAAADARLASKWNSAVRIAPGGLVLVPASGAFDVTVAPGENVQAAVDACPPGGCVLLLPGAHDGPLVLAAGKVVHVFGRGRALLQTSTGTLVTSESATSTLDGLIIRREASHNDEEEEEVEEEEEDDFSVWIKGGRLHLQACDVTSAALDSTCVVIEGGADPLLVSCKCARLSFPVLSLALLSCKCVRLSPHPLFGGAREGLWPPVGWGRSRGLSTGPSNGQLPCLLACNRRHSPACFFSLARLERALVSGPG